MIPREMFNKIRPIKICTTRIVTELLAGACLRGALLVMLKPLNKLLAITAILTLLATISLQAVDTNAVFTARENAIFAALTSKPANWEEFEKGTRALIKDFPDRPNGYEHSMLLVDHYSRSDSKRAIALAGELDTDATPEKFRLWAKGVLNRMENIGKPVHIQFTAIDGREVDAAKLRGKVVLVDFWASICGPCVLEMPKIKSAYVNFHEKGFEVVGVSFDNQQRDLEKYIKKRALPWPQFFDGDSMVDGKFGRAFGISGIPRLMLIDKKGNLRFDDVNAEDLDKKIAELLAEQ